MFKFFAKYFASGQIKLDEGFILLLGQRMLFFPTRSMVEIQKELQRELGEQRGSYRTYQLLKKSSLWYPEWIEEHIGLSVSQMANWMEEVSTGGGWGIVKIEDFNKEQKGTIVTIDKSPFPEWFQSDHSCCHATRGLIAGVLSGILKDDIDAVERECVGTGAKKCIIIFQPRTEWLKVKSPDLESQARWQLPDLFV